MEILSAEPLASGTRGRPRGATADIRERHHACAKLVAAGVSYAQAGRLVGMTAAGVEAWAKNPANAELIVQYGPGKLLEAVDTFLEQRAAIRNELSFLALLKVRDQLLEAIDAGTDVPMDKLVKIAADSDDRTGLARMETRVNINAGLGSKLDEATKRVEGLDKARAEGRVVDFVRRA